MTPIPDQLHPFQPDELRSMPARQLRALVSAALRERQAIHQQAVSKGADTELGQRLADVDALELACRAELTRRGRFRTLRRALIAARSQL